MNGYKISEAARASGFSVSALRFYEKEGVVVPDRTDTGYRAYHQEHIEALRFVARAKTLGLTLPEITELLALISEDCRQVQSRMRQLFGERIREAQHQIKDLFSFTVQLQEADSQLGVHTAQGGCDDRCGCRTDPIPANTLESTAVSLLGSGSSSSAVACSLEPNLLRARIDEWKATVTRAEDREPIPEGIRLRFPRAIDITALAQLAADEQTCCGFFTFTLGIHPDHVILDVTGPTVAQPVITAMFGFAA